MQRLKRLAQGHNTVPLVSNPLILRFSTLLVTWVVISDACSKKCQWNFVPSTQLATGKLAQQKKRQKVGLNECYQFLFISKLTI